MSILLFLCHIYSFILNIGCCSIIVYVQVLLRSLSFVSCLLCRSQSASLSSLNIVINLLFSGIVLTLIRMEWVSACSTKTTVSSLELCVCGESILEDIQVTFLFLTYSNFKVYLKIIILFAAVVFCRYLGLSYQFPILISLPIQLHFISYYCRFWFMSDIFYSRGVTDLVM